MCRIFVSETYSIVDASYFNTNTITTSDNIINIDLSENYEVSFNFTRKSTSSASGVLVGTNGTRNAYIGQYASSGAYGVFFLNPNNPVQLGTSSTNSEVTFILKYDNGTYTMSNGSNTVTLTDFKITHITQINGATNCPVSNVLIKPL